MVYRVCIVILLASLSAICQVVGGKSAFEFINFPANAHLAALGHYNVSVIDTDPYLTNANPALLNKKMSKHVSFSYVPFLADIKSYSVAGAYDFKDIGPVSLSVAYMNYGKFSERLEDGTLIGEYGANDYVVTLGKSYTLGVITLGANLKYLGSEIGTYRARGIAGDAGAVFQHPEHDFTFGMAIKNFGKVTRSMTSTSSHELPFDVQLGTSYRFEHAPLRVSLTGHHLNQWNIVYNDPALTTKLDEQGNPVIKKVRNVERLLRHLVLGLEIMPAKFLSVRAGYNYLMSRELSLTESLSSSGISLGGAVKWSFLEASYSHTILHKAGGMNTFTLNINMGEINNTFSSEN